MVYQASMMPRTCCCYTVDETYLPPATVSAIQLRKNLSPDLGDVLIICFGERSHTTDLFKSICFERNILFAIVPHKIRNGLSMYHARFFIEPLIGSEYNKVLYLDGDTQVIDTVDQLINFNPGAGCIVATLDPMSLIINNNSRKNLTRRNYLVSIGLPEIDHENYFNSGVMLFDRNDWKNISKDCLKMIYNCKEMFQFPDQDPLNVVMRGHVVHASFKWNFPAFFLNFGIERLIDPNIYHFMSNPRPWQGEFAPWTKNWVAPYDRLVRDFPEIEGAFKKANLLKSIKYGIRQKYVEIIEGANWRNKVVISKIVNIEKTSRV